MDKSFCIIFLCFVGIQIVLYFVSEAQTKNTRIIGEKTTKLLVEANLMNKEIEMNIEINKNLYETSKAFALEHGLIKEDKSGIMIDGDFIKGLKTH